MTESRILRGVWWLANTPSSGGVAGTLTLEDDEFRLELEGALSPDREFDSDIRDRILGETTDLKKVTLEACSIAARSIRGKREGESRVIEAYRAEIACIGGWFAAEESVAFDTVSVRLSSLHSWTAVSGFDPMWQAPPSVEGGAVTQTYLSPPEQRARLSDGATLKLSFPLMEIAKGLRTYEKTFTQATQFVFEFPDPRQLDNVKKLVFDLRNFLTLAVGEGVKVTALVGYRKPLTKADFPHGREVEIIYQHIENPNARELTNDRRMIFTLPDISERFEEHITRWFDGAPQLGRVLDHYFSTLHVDFVYLETRFLNYAQAIEGYHRRRLDRKKFDKKTFKTYCDTILEGLEGDVRDLARSSLVHKDEVGLSDRIEDTLRVVGAAGMSITSAGNVTLKGFAKRVAEIRNTYAHNLERKEPDGRELLVVTLQLRALMEALFLREIGFAALKIDELLREATRYREIQHFRGSH